MEYQKIANLWGNIPDKVHTFITKKWIKFLINLDKHTTLTNKLDLKHQC